jgi:hypothetical protein
VERDLKDAEVPGLSSDRRFAIAYNAALQLATVVLYAEGYRSTGTGHHHTTFRFLGQTTIPNKEAWADYFDACRRKRNLADYMGVGYVSETEADELVRETRAFAQNVREWLSAAHPYLAPG